MKKVAFLLVFSFILACFPAVFAGDQESISSFPSYLEGVTPRGGETWRRMFQMLLKKETAVFSYPYSVAAATTINIPATPSYVIITSDGVASGNAVDIATSAAKDGQVMFVVNKDAQTTSGDITLAQNQVGLLMFCNSDWRAISNPGAVTAAVTAAITAAILADNATDAINLAAAVASEAIIRAASDGQIILDYAVADTAHNASMPPDLLGTGGVHGMVATSINWEAATTTYLLISSDCRTNSLFFVTPVGSMTVEDSVFWVERNTGFATIHLEASGTPSAAASVSVFIAN